MTEQTFKSPGFYDREFDRSTRIESPTGIPCGIVATAKRGPAFVPVTLGSFADFSSKFGSLDSKMFGPYAVQKFLENRSSALYMRVLGAGTNDTIDDIEKTRVTGQVRSAGFWSAPTASPGAGNRFNGAIQYLVADHAVTAQGAVGMPMINDNNFFSNPATSARMLRAAIIPASDSKIMIYDQAEVLPADLSTIDDEATLTTEGIFKIAVSSSAGLKTFDASLDPASPSYYGKVLNTNPDKFEEQGHYLYLDFSVDAEVAKAVTTANGVAILRGSNNTSVNSGDTSMDFLNAFGRFDTRFQAPKTTWFISQPFGKTENNLFYFESVDDGEWANTKVKISITNLRGSTSPNTEYGTFTVLVRDYDDTDTDPQVLEQFAGCTLDPDDENYIARRIGDSKTFFNFDEEIEEERRLQTIGSYPLKSRYIRVRVAESVEKKLTPAKALPFGFRGLPTIKTNVNGLDTTAIPAGDVRLAGNVADTDQFKSVVPPLPFRYKVTRGAMATSGFAGAPGISEETDGRYYWGVKLERNKNPLNSNTTREKSKIVEAYTKLAGLEKLDVLTTGSFSDEFNNNKFTLARVALPNETISQITGTVGEHMRETVYVRNGDPDGSDYRIDDSDLGHARVTFATLSAQNNQAEFNRFTDFAKFTTVMHGGFDGVNILDKNARRLDDKSSSSDVGGGASLGYNTPGLSFSPAGEGKLNNAVFAYRTAAKIMLDPFTLSSNFASTPQPNLLAVPGIRDSFVTDFISEEVRKCGTTLYVMDMVSYDDNNNRIFDDESIRPDVEKTAAAFDSRVIDNSYVATFFPDVIINDEISRRRVKVPSSIAALSAISFNDRVGFPWFAPAGFNRGGLNFVTGLDVRLKASDRDTLYDNRINPIANVIEDAQTTFLVLGQKTLAQGATAVNRINVRRLQLQLRSSISFVAKQLVFEQNDATTRSRFTRQANKILALVQQQSGILAFRVVMDESNNTQIDEEQNRMNGKIIVVPTKTIENIAVDFIITNSGVEFVA